MGHDISGFIKGQTSKEISYLKIGGFNTNKSFFFYDAIQSQDCNGGIYGTGLVKTFTNEELKLSKRRLKYMLGENEDEIQKLVYESTSEIVPKISKTIEEFFGIDMDSIAPQICEEERVMIGESINNFLDKLIETGGDVEIYFG